MCGIAGIVSPSQIDSESINKMCNVIKHRGPDDSGIWVDEKSHFLAFGHRRLSILDLSSHGHQPMISPSGRFVMAFNGEIYNFSYLKKQVEETSGFTAWNGYSDTEFLLASFEKFGIKNTLKKVHGMFAISVFDRDTEKLYLTRDRMGEKPLYYGKIDNTFYFCSELKSIKEVLKNQLKIFKDALSLYIRHGYIPSPWSIYENIYKLQPGHILELDCTNISEQTINPHEAVPYWDIYEEASKRESNLFSGTDKNAVDKLETLLTQSVSKKMITDVPLGSFLSGGYDSSLITALMQKQSTGPVRSFSIGFDIPGYNEALHAKAVAKHLGTSHTELYIQSQDALDVIPKLPTMYCEPFADSSQIPTYLVSKMTREYVTVALSGDGGDELFCGYSRYFWAINIWKKIHRYPPAIRQIFVKIVTQIPPKKWNNTLKFLIKFLPYKFQYPLPGDKLHKLAGILGSLDVEDVYYRLTSAIQDPSELLKHSTEALSALTDPKRKAPLSNSIDKMMFTDMVSYLPDDILCKVDRAGMAVSLETRIPFLDHSVVEFALGLPQNFKIRNGNGKWIVKELTHRHIPKTLMERPKMGFGVPIDSWLRGPLKEWAAQLLSKKKLDDQGYFNTNRVIKMWNEHISAERNWSHQLWIILMFQEWLETQ